VLDASKRGRGRPPKFDRVTALRAMQGVFCELGLAGMNRPSLYAAFGDKRAMFLMAVAAADERWAVDLGRHLRAQRLTAALASLFADATTAYLSNDAAGHGYLIATAAIEAASDATIEGAVGAAISGADRAFADRLRVAQASGDAAIELDVAATGRLLTACLQSLALRARAGASRKDLDSLSQGAISLVRDRRSVDHEWARRWRSF
jgi:TetR/AcrR family transcriptional regulator, copper-responsive repressor